MGRILGDVRGCDSLLQHKINQIHFTTAINTVLETAPSLGILTSGPLCEVVQGWSSAWLRTMLYCDSFHMTSALGPGCPMGRLPYADSVL